jgi:hypothetical protein
MRKTLEDFIAAIIGQRRPPRHRRRAATLEYVNG